MRRIGESSENIKVCHYQNCIVWLGMRTHLFQKCGNKGMPGIITKAGKVIRLKVPNTSKNPRTKLIEIEERFCGDVSGYSKRDGRTVYLFMYNPIYQHQAPKNDQSLD